MHHQIRGLTLIELMIGLTVLALVLTLAVPSFARFVQEQRMTAAANHLVTHLQFARNEAIVRNSFVSACPSSDGLSCTGGNRWDTGWIVYLDPHKQSQPLDPSDVLRVVSGDGELTLYSAGRYRVRFRAHGGAYGTNLTIRICDPDRRAEPRAVIVSNPGRVRATRDLNPSECDFN